MNIKTLIGWLMALAVVIVCPGCGDATEPTGDGGAQEPCTSHADCDDDLFCTGDELCMPSHADALPNGCLLGTPPCSSASCDEAAEMCDSGCPDADNDGHTDAACGGDDCDDDDDQRFPGNPEVCDLVGHDEDCDPCTVGSTDADSDLFISAVCTNDVSDAPTCGIDVLYDATEGHVRGLDCNDATGMIKPGQAETCNAVDDDCDDDVDENLTLSPYWPDVDMDQAGDESATPTQACARPEGFAASAGDCDDGMSEVRPFGTELCDELDNDCDGETDEQSASYTFYRDMDGDGVGNSAMPTTAATCEPPTGYSAVPGDCNDNAPLIYPGAIELCDRIDNNCSLVVNPGGAAADEDADSDGHAPVGATCSSAPAGTFSADDCDESNATIHGGAVEFCSGIDEDCDGETDEAGANICGRGDTCDEGCLSGERLSVGSEQSCAVLDDGGLACWSDEGAAVPERVAGISGAEQVSTGGYYGCVRLADRTVRCWGANDYGQLGVGHTMPVSGVVTPLGLGEVLAVDAGYLHTCALKTGGEVWCWGDNDLGQLGLGHTTVTPTPTRVTGVEGAVEVHVRSGGACARTGDGHVYCWGFGATGDGATTSSLVPDRANVTGALELATGFSGVSACVRQASGWSCWGRGGSAGTGTASVVLTPTALAVPGEAEQVTLASSFGCALEDGAVACWGESTWANFGESRRPAETVPGSMAMAVPLTVTPSAIDCSNSMCCGLAGTDVTCWGSPHEGRLGDGPRDGTTTNVPIGLSNVTAIALGGQTTCAIDDAGLQCWGDGSRAGFADGLTRFLPHVLTASGITEVSIGSSRACTRDAAGTVRCWGTGAAGDLAQTRESLVPVVVDGTAMGSAMHVVTGRNFSCALDTAGAAWCWGDGNSGVCGTSMSGCVVTPTRVVGGLTFASLSIGGDHVCGVTTGADLYCWGLRTDGQVGDGSTSNSVATPQRVRGEGGVGFLTNITHVEAATWSTCALRNDGRVLCFGYGNGHALGNGSQTSVSTPVAVSGLTDAQALTCYGSSCLARRPDDTWVGWGNDATALGTAGAGPVPTPAPAAFGLELVSVELAFDRACGRDSAGVTHCWGASNEGNPLALPLITVVALPD